ncbi:DNA topoisomerase 3 [Faecalibacterium prausnitzii]|uniref:DNA topoisomerase 3 n=1 Tax=Faecalibacterium prausnitzii TaxID=853 RepID=UPI0022E53E18|nr:DNA topoisomerase 3 [Faecalibacterium prausnitzii]
MSFQLVIAEKPSVARSIATVIGADEKQNGYWQGDGYLVSWCIGHLVSFAEAGQYDEKYCNWKYEDLPILPQPWQFIVPDEKKQQFEIVRSLLNRPDVDSVTAATDAGREGELIFRFVYQMAGCTKPVKRLWISSMEDAAIREGFANLRPDSDYDALYQSALCRAKADWLVGINATRLFSVLYHKTLTVGRVQTPTLKMLVDRDAKILRFQKEKYYTVGIQSGSLKAGSGRIASMDEADTLKNACAGASAICSSVKREKKTEQPPKLYDLTTLQREANRLFGFTAKQTLDYAQQLYEKKLLTYPRTDSQYLTEDMGQTAQHLVSDLLGLLPFAQGLALTAEVGRVLNSKKVSDHHAIIPTSEFAKQGFTGLAESECKLLNLVCSKLLCAIAAPHEYETVTAVFSCAGNEFTAKGKTVLVPGWKEIDQRFRSTLKADGEEETETLNTLPELTEGQSYSVVSDISEHFTSPPKAYTEDTLLSAMERAGAEDMPENAERKGLGTPATRAAILEKLVQMGFVQRKGKQLVPTKDGINLAVVLPESLTSPALTAEWDNPLTETAKGNADADEFMAEIEAQVRRLVKTYSCISADKQNLFQSERVIIGKCPRCGENVYEGKKNFYCGNRSCQFVMWKNDRFFEQPKQAFTPKIAAALLKNGKAQVKALYSEKSGKTYDATVLLADTGGKFVNYRVERNE